MPMRIGLPCAREVLMNGTVESAVAATAPCRILRRVLLLWLIAVLLLVRKSLQLDGVELRRQHHLEQLAVVGIVEHAVADLRRLQAGGALLSGVHVFAFVFGLCRAFPD